MDFLQLIGMHILICLCIGIAFGVFFRKMIPGSFIAFGLTWIGLLSLSLLPRVLKGVEIHSVDNTIVYLTLELFYSFAFSVFVFPGFYAGLTIRNLLSKWCKAGKTNRNGLS